MKKILGLILAGLALNAQAQMIVEQPLGATAIAQKVLENINKMEGSKPNPAVVGYMTASLTCGGVSLPPTSHTILSTDPIIDFNIKILQNTKNKTVVMNDFGLSTTENVVAPISNTNTQTYIGSIKTEKIPSKDSKELNEKVTIVPQQITTGTFLSLQPTVVNNTIVTKLCFEQSELLGFKKMDNLDIELPDTKGMYGLWNIALTPGKEFSFMVNSDTTLKIKADIRKR